MEQYISKSALVAEIERRLHFDNNWIEGDKRRQIHTNSVSSAYYKRIGSKHACESILDFINTIEVKEIDLKKEIEDYMFNNTFFIINASSKETVTALAKHFFELGLKAQKGE